MSPRAYSAVYRKEANSCFSFHAASLLILQSPDLPYLFRAISDLPKDNVVNKRGKQAIMSSLSLFSETTNNLYKLVLFLRFSLLKLSVTDTSLLEIPICQTTSLPQLNFLYVEGILTLTSSFLLMLIHCFYFGISYFRD